MVREEKFHFLSCKKILRPTHQLGLQWKNSAPSQSSKSSLKALHHWLCSAVRNNTVHIMPWSRGAGIWPSSAIDVQVGKEEKVLGVLETLIERRVTVFHPGSWLCALKKARSPSFWGVCHYRHCFSPLHFAYFSNAKSGYFPWSLFFLLDTLAS
jgi:hypothetical protein